MKTALVTTTIHVPKNLEGYCENLARHGYVGTDGVEIIVIGDLKSPPETATYLAELEQRSGTKISWWDADRQREWLAELPELDALLPWNSVQRRNLAYLLAAVGGAECIITIDDDNFATDHDFLGGHSIIGKRESLPVVASSSGWFNTSSLLVTSPSKPLYHRGYPTNKRGLGEELKFAKCEGRVVVNAGLWLGAPDADAMCHLNSPVEVIGFREGFAEDFNGRMAVAHGTNMVFNSQNTAFHRDVLPAMFLMPMGDRVGHLEVGRYDDIWMSMFVKVIADHLGDLVCAGIPLVRQNRNQHDLINDLLIEVPAMRITNTFTKSLERVELSGTDYAACYLELIEGLRGALSVDGYSADERRYLEEMYRRMETWVRVSQGFLAPVE